VALSEAEVQRYARQLLLPGFGPASQEALRAARVHVVGAGAVAGPALVYLAAAGVGTLSVDDGADVAAADAAHWLCPPDRAGEPRAFVALEGLRAVNGLVRARAHASGFPASAALVCPESPMLAREASDRARQLGLPHVVAQGDGDGGWVVSIPSGAPCYACAQRGSAALTPTPGAGASLGALAALELLLLLAQAVQEPAAGRRIELVRGQPLVRATVRQANCACASGA
jgi:adenylyltransferase/sulfurtransferase